MLSAGLGAAAPAALGIVVTSSTPLWYLSRATGLVDLVLFSVVVVLGVLQVARWSRPGWPRFVMLGLHRNASLLAVGLLAAHIVTAELDTFVHVGLASVVVPGASPYKPLWIGLGTFALDLMVVVTLTSLVRNRLGFRTWRAIHWMAYAAWPAAIFHTFGAGGDTNTKWGLALVAACMAAVALAVVWRVTHVEAVDPESTLVPGGRL